MDLQVLGDRYELLEPIGRGGMATIYRARDRRMGRLVAVKILREMYSSDPKFVLRFQREARAVSALAHPNIVQVFDYGQSDDAYYIVMELIEGVDLRKYLRTNGVLDVRRSVVIAHDVALALGAAHRRGIVHRDVKPQNILVNDEALVKLTDFGIATFYRDVNSERLTTTGMTLGTVQYYAPEQAQGEVVSPAADVYALGIVMYEMLVGHPPFDGDTPVSIAVRHIQEPPVRPSRYNPNIPPALERVILRCLEKDPRDRYRDGDALAYALESFDKPRSNSQGRMSAPISGVPPMGGNGGGQPPRMSRPIDRRTPSGPRMRQDDDLSGPLGVPGGFPPIQTRADVAAGTSPGRGMGPPDEDEPSPVAGITTAVIVAAVLLLVGVGCFLTFKVFLGGGGGSSSTVQVQTFAIPDFVGMTLDQAKQLASSKGLNVTATSEKSDLPENQVIDQNPTKNTQVSQGDKVTLGYSSGAGKVPVPNVAGESYEQACVDLVKALLNCNKKGSKVGIEPIGTVEDTDPPIGSSVAEGTYIDLYISLGQPTATVGATVTGGTAGTATTGTPGGGTPTRTPTPTVTTTAPTVTPTPTTAAPTASPTP